MKLEWDFQELFDFGDRISDIARFESFCKTATEEVAKILLRMLKRNTPVDYGNLQARWDSDNVGYTARQTARGFEVVLINGMKYARWVNDGHKQRPGRFIPGYWEGKHFRYDPTATGGMVLKKPWVQGRFFVEKSLLQLENGRQFEQIIYKHLQKWWKECLNG